jgi:hypothetical protein
VFAVGLSSATAACWYYKPEVGPDYFDLQRDDVDASGRRAYVSGEAHYDCPMSRTPAENAVVELVSAAHGVLARAEVGPDGAFLLRSEYLLDNDLPLELVVGENRIRLRERGDTTLRLDLLLHCREPGAVEAIEPERRRR